MQPSPADPALDAFLLDHGLAKPGEAPRWSPLTGGVSSEIWRVDLPGRSLCVKRALARLKVEDVWEAPVSRNAYEWKWLQFAARHAPDVVPTPLAHDAGQGLFAMEFLPPERYPVWKAQLLEGRVEPAFAARVADALARLHDASAGRDDLGAEFDSLDNFRALRLEPYLLATARRHPDLARALEHLVDVTAAGRIALVHGDVSPKNLLAGPCGPIFLDAECAWYGDPAFALAFCLNHLVLKRFARPDREGALRESFAAFVEAYFARATFEPRAALEARAAALLPGLLLARIDGKSPVEYLAGNEPAREAVRKIARAALLIPPRTLCGVDVPA